MKKAHAALLVLVCSVLPGGCKNDDGNERPAQRARPVLTVVAERQSGALAAFAGTIEPRYSSTLAFRVVGRVVAREVNVGDGVRKGAHLAALDPLPFDLAVNEARAGLADAKAQFANAEAAEKRLRILFEENHASSQQFEAAQQARQATEAAVTRARSVLEKALEQRGYAELGSEFDGVVTAVDTEVGQVVTPGQPVITIARPDVREAVIDLPDDAAANLQEGNPFQVALLIDPSKRIEGRVREIAPLVDALTRSRRVKIALDDPPANYRLGTTITAYVPAQSSGQIRIPETALLERDGRQHVWTVDSTSRTVTLHAVTIAGRDAGTVAVSEGIRPGDRVVTAGVHSLVDGQSVKISERASQ